MRNVQRKRKLFQKCSIRKRLSFKRYFVRREGIEEVYER